MSSRIADAILGRRSIEDPTKPLTDVTLVEWLRGEPVEAGISVSPETALRLTAVYRAIALLAGLIGSLPLKSFRRQSAGGPIEIDSPIIREPHADATPLEFWEYVGVALFTHGNAYNLKIRDGGLRIRELWPLHPARMTRVERKRAWRTELNPTGKRFFYDDDGTERVYTPFEVLHIPGLSYNGITGLSPIGAARQGIGLSLAAERFGARMFGRGALVQGVLQTDQKIDQDKADQIRAQFREKVSGQENQWEIPVLHSGLQWQQIGLPPQDVQFIETRQFGVAEIARLYGLPPHLLADVERSTSWGTGIEQQNLGLLIFTLDPWLVRIEQRATKELLLPDEFAKYKRQALMRADTASRWLAYQRAFEHSALNADEIRDLEEQPPLSDEKGQIYYRPKNLEPVESSGGGDA